MKKYNKIDLIVSIITIFVIIVWLILCLSPKTLGIILFILLIAVVIIGFCAMMMTFNDEGINNGKEGYYAQYGTSFGANADKHEKYKKRKEQYLEEQVANKIMKGKERS